MEKIDAMLPTLVPVFIVLVFAAIVFAIVCSCVGVFAGLIHASKDKSLQRHLQTVLTNAKAQGDLMKSYKEAGVDPIAAPFVLPTLTPQPLGSPDAPARKGLGIVPTILLAVIAVCLVILTAGQFF